MTKVAAVLLTAVAITACGSPRAGQAPPPRDDRAAPAVMATPLPKEAVPAVPVIGAPAPVVGAPAPVVGAPAPAPPAQMTVTLGALAPGTYTVHLHTICNGGTAFHITTLGFVRASEPVLTLPASDFGKGWCLVVYTDPSATKVVAYRPI